MKSTIEFKSNSKGFLRRTVHRLFYELAVLAVLVVAIALKLLPAIPMWIQWAVVASVAMYIGVGIALYPRAKAVSDSLSIKLNDQGLTFVHSGGRGELQYSDLKIARVRKRGDRLTEIVLAARSGQKIKLQDLENLDELYRLLSARVTS
jgi:hypothetical protein